MVANTREDEERSLAAQPLQAGAQPIAPQPQTQQQVNGQPISGGQSAFTQGGAGISTPSRPQDQPKNVGTGQPSLGKFIQANLPGGQQMMGQVQKQAGQQSSQIQQNIEQQKSALMQQVDANRNRFQEAYGQIMGTPATQGVVERVTQIGADEGLSGLGLTPQQISDIQKLYQDALGRGDTLSYTKGLGYNQQKMLEAEAEAQKAANLYAGLGSEDFRKRILRKTFGERGSDYTRGMSQLDALLMGQGTPEQQQRQFLGQMRDIGEANKQALSSAKRYARESIAGLKGEERGLEQSLRSQLESAYGLRGVDDPTTEIDESQFYESGIAGELDRRIREQDTPYFHALGRLQRGETLTEEDKAILGESLSDTRTYGTDIVADLLGAEETRSSVASKDELARLNALAELRSMNQDILLDPTAVAEKSQSIVDALYGAEIEKQQALDALLAEKARIRNAENYYRLGDRYQQSYRRANQMYGVGMGPWRGEGHAEWGYEPQGYQQWTQSFVDSVNALADQGYYDTASGGFDRDAYETDLQNAINEANRYRGYDPQGQLAYARFSQPLIAVPEGRTMDELLSELTPEQRELDTSELINQGLISYEDYNRAQEIANAEAYNSGILQRHASMYGEAFNIDDFLRDYSSAVI